MKVCIAEKPSVAAEIAKVLGASARKEGYFEGNGYQVTWTFGHLCQLKKPESYNDEWKKWRLEHLPMLPDRFGIELIDNASSKRQFKVIKSLYSKADLIINCGDAGQEGELIQRWVMELAGVRCPVKRLWISSLTEEAIRKGFTELKDQRQYDRLYDAGLARARGDWLLGMNCTRLYSVRFANFGQTLSVGRVQTPTLAMIVARDREIANFTPSLYWVLTTVYRGATFTCQMDEGKFCEKAKGMALLERVRPWPLEVTGVERKEGKEQPPQLYDLTSLQVDCNRKYGMSAEMTLNTIQSLYEKKLTTYPRVDTRFLPSDQWPKVPAILSRLSSQAAYSSIVSLLGDRLAGYRLQRSSRVFDDSKVTDHHAIIPTGVTPGQVNENERKVYDLVLRRFVAAFCPAMAYAQTIVLAKAENVQFKATGRTILSDGWRKVYAGLSTDEEEKGKEAKEETVLPAFTRGESGPHRPELLEKVTKPPKHYTEASLLQAMETAGKMVDDEQMRQLMKENGIGRPSSRASIIETLLKRKYICREKKNLVSCVAGRELIDTIAFPLLKSPELTGQWEKKLRDIEHGCYSLSQFMSELTSQVCQITDSVMHSGSTRKIGLVVGTKPPVPKKAAYPPSKPKAAARKASVKKANPGDKCPLCGKGTVRKGPYGLFCDQYKISGCKYRG